MAITPGVITPPPSEGTRSPDPSMSEQDSMTSLPTGLNVIPPYNMSSTTTVNSTSGNIVITNQSLQGPDFLHVDQSLDSNDWTPQKWAQNAWPSTGYNHGISYSNDANTTYYQQPLSYQLPVPVATNQYNSPYYSHPVH